MRGLSTPPVDYAASMVESLQFKTHGGVKTLIVAPTVIVLDAVSELRVSQHPLRSSSRLVGSP